MYTQRITYGRRLADVRIVDPDVPLGVSPPTTTTCDANLPPVAAAPVVPVPPSETQILPSLELQADLDEQWAEIESFFGSIEEQFKEVEDRRRQMLGELQQLAVELAVSIASRLVYDTIDADAFRVDEMVAQMLSRFEASESTEIRLHPEDLQLLKRRVEGKQPPWADQSSYRLVADAKLQRGDCRIESGDFGMLSGVDLQLSEFRNHLMESLDNAQIERRRTQAGDSSLRRFPDRRDTA